MAAPAVPLAAPDSHAAPWVKEPIPQLALGRPGKDGQLVLRLVRDELRGITVAERITHRSPLQIGRVLYPDAHVPDMAYCYVALLTGGLVQGDRLSTDVALGCRGRAHVTTLSATKMYRMERNGAEQRIALTVGAGAVLEWWPDPVIPFRGSRLWQDVRATVDASGVLLYADLLLPGRAADGECHDYAYYRSRFAARRPDGALLFVDTQALAPPPVAAAPLRETLPSHLQCLGTVYALVPLEARQRVLGALREWCATADHAHLLPGCSVLPGDSGLALRFLAASARNARAALGDVLTLLRRELLGAGTPTTRKP